MLDRILREPTGLVEVLRQVVLWGLAMGFISLTPEQQTQTFALLSVLLAWANRALVTPASDAKGKHDA